jgi:DNA-binding transcriptional LysR family regulator
MTPPTSTTGTDDHLVVQGLVAAGVGVALLPHIAVPTIRRDIVITAPVREWLPVLANALGRMRGG